MDEQEYVIESKDRLVLQVATSYADLLYSYKVHNTAADIDDGRYNRLSVFQTCLTSVSACGFMGILLNEERTVSVVAAGLSVVSLAINIYLKGANLCERSVRHRRSADAMWTVLQNYRSLLTDCDSLDLSEIKARRDALQSEVEEIYAKCPRTNSSAYRKARAAIKAGDYNYSLKELREILPVGLKDLVKRSMED